MSKYSSPYHEAGSILNELLSSKSDRRGLKSLAFSKSNRSSAPKKSMYATVCKSIQYLPIIDSVLDSNGGKLRKDIEFETAHNKGLLYVMLYELLFGKYKSIRGGGRLKRMITVYERELRRGVEDYLSLHGENSGVLNDGLSLKFPRYVRVNTLMTDTQEVLHELKKDFENEENEDNKSNDLTRVHPTENMKNLIFIDAHVPDLLVMHPSVTSYIHQNHDLVKSGKIVLQDKSSCFSALALAHGSSRTPLVCDFIDACAAPGNKTSHLAALINSIIQEKLQVNKDIEKETFKSNIFAFERSSNRFKILKSRIRSLVPSRLIKDSTSHVTVHPIHGDFLKTDPHDPQFANVRGILLDPSCSGSGVVNSPDRWMEGTPNPNETQIEKKKKRIETLANFQLVALKHAMSFSQVNHIVYSTCSLNDEENEFVVARALSEMNTISSQSNDLQTWAMVAPKCLRNWSRRGHFGGIGGLSEREAHCLIRCDGMNGDESNGFFVCYLERRGETLSNDSIVKISDEAKVNTIKGLKVYEGQFYKTTLETKGLSSSLRNDPPVIQSSKYKKQSLKNNSVQKSAKKVEKKLAWKRKQALHKAMRMRNEIVISARCEEEKKNV